MDMKLDNKYNPLAANDAIVQGEHYRFTILTSRLIRVEYSQTGEFEDRPTQMVLHRKFEVPLFKVFEKDNRLEIVTEHVSITYDKQRFSSRGLVFRLRGNYSAYHSIWHFGDAIHDLKGTARTLDLIDGATPLDTGIISRFGFSVIDDSHTSALTEDGWYDKRSSEIDFYFFGYGLEYKTALSDYYQLTGPQPLLPRYTLGNWWSRFFPYNEESYIELMEKFYQHQIPFSVAVIDMDWHVVDVPEQYGSGWTGYTWNKELFPDPERFLEWLHAHHYKVTLNVHPADGVRPFEEMYQPMAEELGLDWENEEFIEFDVTNREFLKAYFKFIHHPNEAIGVDFWWVDWQQGSRSVTGVDPLWVLNHYHYHDIQRDGKLGITFSRYSGPGSHRYPIGFSGDTVITWESLAFQPYFTANASNIGYGWWSHDIGGHMHGYRDNELALRWLQLGVFSPITRLHSSSSVFLGKEPWNYPEPYASIMTEYLRLRHRLVPYLYNMNHKAHQEGLPLIRPMYYEHAAEEASYSVPNQYYFGDDLLVMPLTEASNRQTMRASFNGWLPEGQWYDVQSALVYSGKRQLIIHREIETTGLFAKAGTVLPLASLSEFSNEVTNPDSMELLVFTGADGQMKLVEDDAEQTLALTSAKTRVNYLEAEHSVIIHSAEGDIKVIPEERSWKITFYGLNANEAKLTIGAVEHLVEVVFDPVNNTSSLTIDSISVSEAITVSLLTATAADYGELKTLQIMNYLQQAQIDFLLKERINQIVQEPTSLIAKMSELDALGVAPQVLAPVKEILWTEDTIKQ